MKLEIVVYKTPPCSPCSLTYGFQGCRTVVGYRTPKEMKRRLIFILDIPSSSRILSWALNPHETALTER